MTTRAHARLAVSALAMGLSRLGLALGVVACTGELRSEGPSLDSIPDAGTFPSDAAQPDPVPPPDAAQRSDAWQPPDAWSPPESGCDDPVEQEAIRLVNADRSARGLRTVRCDPAMTAVAREHSTDMCRRGYFDHTGLDGRDPFDRLRDGGVRFSSAGENIAWGQRSAAAVHDAWMHSPGHRRNILDGDYGRIGVGLDRCGGDMYWTQVFAN